MDVSTVALQRVVGDAAQAGDGLLGVSSGDADLLALGIRPGPL